MGCTKHSDKHGTLYRVGAFIPDPTLVRSKKLIARPCVDVWWDRDHKDKSDEDLIIRQDNGEKADVIILTQGQAMDLLRAVAAALLDT